MMIDMALKLYKNMDWTNNLKFKPLSLLGSLFQQEGDLQSMTKIHETIFKGLEQHPYAYELVFATRNYGHLLIKNEETRLEG